LNSGGILGILSRALEKAYTITHKSTFTGSSGFDGTNHEIRSDHFFHENTLELGTIALCGVLASQYLSFGSA
jgi:hypothetical protein